MSEAFNNTCPYCGSDKITSFGHVNNHDIANAEEYVCDGICGKTFHMQHCDEMLIMKPTMNDMFLSSNSLAYREKLSLEKVAKEQGVNENLLVCGNCVSYEWGVDLESKLDRHCGSCSFQKEAFNYTISDSIIRGKLHGLTNAKSCENFYNFRIEKHRT